MESERRYLRTCEICSESFVSRCSNAKYCDGCRSYANELVAKKSRLGRKKKPKPEKPQITVYTCRRCGRKIKAFGICTNRKICDECLRSSRTRSDMQILYQRKEVREEAIEYAGTD